MNKPFERVTVVGAGTLGAQIALLAAYAGYAVKIFDSLPGSLDKTLAILKKDLETSSITPFIPWDRWESCRASISESATLEEAVIGAGIIVEAVPEDIELKKKVFADIGRFASANAIIATNSSSMPVSKFAESSGHPERCINTHFYMILKGMNMADVMGCAQTSPDVLQKGVAWIKSLGLVPLTVNKELLGFCFNRIWRSIKREALSMWGNGYVDFQDVDRAWMIFSGMKTGPFGLMDMVGLDVVHAIETVYYTDSGDLRDKPPKALEKMIEEGKLGLKTGEGFYTYPAPAYSNPDFLIPE